MSEKPQQIERSINKKFRKTIWNPFVAAIKKYKLVESGDCIAVCISGGKDSMLLAKLMQMLQRYSEIPFDLKFISMDPGYTKINREKIISNSEILQIPVEIFDTDIFGIVTDIPKSPCYLCARMRRGHLYNCAKNRECNKIALGHHLDDVVETTVMGMFHGAQIQGMLPKLHSTNFPGMQLIRPLYMVSEQSIISWRDYNQLSFLQCACRFTENAENDIHASKRLETKILLKQLSKDNPQIYSNILNSIHNVCVDTLCEYKINGQRHSFLERF